MADMQHRILVANYIRLSTSAQVKKKSAASSNVED